MLIQQAPRWPLTDDGTTYIKVHSQIIVQSGNRPVPGVVTFLPDDTLGILLRGTPTRRLQFKERVGTPHWLLTTEAADYVRTSDLLAIQTARNTWRSAHQLLDYTDAQWALIPDDAGPWQFAQVEAVKAPGTYTVVDGTVYPLRVDPGQVQDTFPSAKIARYPGWIPESGYLIPLDCYATVIRWQIAHRITHPSRILRTPPAPSKDLTVTLATPPHTLASGTLQWQVTAEPSHQHVTLTCEWDSDTGLALYTQGPRGERWQFTIAQGRYCWYNVPSPHPVRRLTPLEAHAVAAILTSRYPGSPLSSTPAHDAAAAALRAHLAQHPDDFVPPPRVGNGHSLRLPTSGWSLSVGTLSPYSLPDDLEISSPTPAWDSAAYGDELEITYHATWIRLFVGRNGYVSSRSNNHDMIWTSIDYERRHLSIDLSSLMLRRPFGSLRSSTVP